MTKVVRLKSIDNKEINLDSPDNMLAKCSVQSALLIPNDAVVSMSYEVDGRQYFVRMNETGTIFILPVNWSAYQFFVNWKRIPTASPNTIQREKPDNLGLEKILHWEYRVFMVAGQHSQGSGVLISHRKILTARHLSFKIDEWYLVKGTNNRAFNAKCLFISESADFAILTSEEVPELDTPIDNISRGSKYFILGYPSGSSTAQPSLTQGVIQGATDDKLHIIGTPGSKPGYSGAPVFDKFGALVGILLGSIPCDTTIHEVTASSAEQKYSRILPILSINALYNDGRSVNQSSTSSSSGASSSSFNPQSLINNMKNHSY